MIDAFSRRTALIEEKARDKGITRADDKAGLGAKTRAGKQKDMSWEELQAWWRTRLTSEQQDHLAAIYVCAEPQETNQAIGREALHHAAEHHFERSAVVRERAILETALRYGVGSTGLADIRKEYEHEGLLTREHDDDRLATTRAVLAEEQAMLAFARDGRAAARPLNPQYSLTRDWLNAEQQAAVRHVLGSTDRVMIIAGLAGTGKSTLTSEALDGLNAAKVPYLVVAPTTQATDVLRKDGIEAVTLQRLLVDAKLHDTIRNGVLWIDEAGLVSSRDMAKAFAFAKDQHARVVLTGDAAQHTSVARGEALRLLETQAGIQPVRIRTIVRQHGDYKAAVQDFAAGRVGDGFDKLDGLGWVTEGEDELRYLLLARDYADACQAKAESQKDSKAEGAVHRVMTDKLLVVSPTHAEAARATAAIRDVLQSRGIIGKTSRMVERLAATNWTEAGRADVARYRDTPGLVVQFVQNAKGFQRGSRGEVVGVAGNTVTIRTKDTLAQLPLAQAGRFQVYRRESLDLATGDLIRITANGKSADGHALTNGAVYSVGKVAKSGAVTLANGWRLDAHWGHLASGYVVTSHASQGRTVDQVFVAASSESSPAVNQAMAYVSTSRGREAVRLYTDNKDALREAMTRGITTLTATELVLPKWWQRVGANLQRRAVRLAAYGTRMLDSSHERVARREQGAVL